MLEWLHDAQIPWVVDFIRNVASGFLVDIFVHTDFRTLPCKRTHGLGANARALLSFTTT